MVEKRTSSGGGRERISAGPVPRPSSRRDEIIAATIRVISEHGIAGATMRAIAREMDLTTGVISHYFQDKSGLLHEALQTCFDPWTDLLKSSEVMPNPWERFRHLILSSNPAHKDRLQSRRVWLGLLVQIDREPRLWQAYQERYGHIREHMLQLFRQCQREGYVRNDLDALTECNHLLALVDGLMISAIGEPDRFTETLTGNILKSHVNSLLNEAQRSAQPASRSTKSRSPS